MDFLDEETPKTVEEFLNEVDYAWLNGYVPSQFALEFVNFMKLVDGGENENKTPVVHFKMLDNFIQDNGLDTINMCHRGFAKSTLKEYLILYLAVFNELPGLGVVPYALYVSDSMENGVSKMRKSLELRYQNSAFLQQYLPEKGVKFTETRWEFNNIDGKKFVVTGHGAKSGVRGTRENGSRPVLALLDDLISDKDANSPTIIAAVEDVVYNAIDYALHPKKRKVIWSGTPFNGGDPLYKGVNTGAYNVNVYPVCEQFPCSEEEFRGSWEDRFDYESIKKLYNKAVRTGKLHAFNQELMLRIMSEEDRLIQDADISWYKRGTVLNNKSRYNFYITTDFATGNGEHNDFSVISVWAYNNNGDWLWVDGVCKKQLMDQNVNDLFRLASMYRPQSVGIEVSGQQQGFIPWIEDEMHKRNVWFTIASENNNGKKGIRPINTQKKIERFHTIVPLFKANKMFFPIERKTSPELQQCMNELTLVSGQGFKSKHDDFSDTISMLTVMKPWKPSETGDLTQDSDGLWDDDMGRDDLDSGLNSYIV